MQALCRLVFVLFVDNAIVCVHGVSAGGDSAARERLLFNCELSRLARAYLRGNLRLLCLVLTVQMRHGIKLDPGQKDQEQHKPATVCRLLWARRLQGH